jgi:Fe-S-cluster containining protein
MADQDKNTWGARIKRTFTSVLPVAQQRRGQCIQCGACCKLPNVCPFLKSNGDGRIYCRIYPIRPLNCRKYPRTPSEHITTDTCGFRFEDREDQCEV